MARRREIVRALFCGDGLKAGEPDLMWFRSADSLLSTEIKPRPGLPHLAATKPSIAVREGKQHVHDDAILRSSHNKD